MNDAAAISGRIVRRQCLGGVLNYYHRAAASVVIGTAREQLSGVLDFYFAAVDALVFDVAVCLNAWCADATTGALFDARAGRVLATYERVRALDAQERALSPAAPSPALRFWISRLYDLHLPRSAALLEAHDPKELEQALLRTHRARACPGSASSALSL
jgi:homoserine kinase type II